MEIDRLAPTSRPKAYSIMRQRWAELLFLHWEADAAQLQKLLPSGLELDTYEGKAYVGLVPFTMTGVRPTVLPPYPPLSNFHEINVRTYVHRKGRDPGVWFFSLDAANAVAVRLARAWYKLPYHFARMSLDVSPERTHYYFVKVELTGKVLIGYPCVIILLKDTRMALKKYQVALSPEQRHRAEVIARSYKHSALERNRAKILLLADIHRAEGDLTDGAICQQTGFCLPTVERVRKRFAGGGFETALFRVEQTNRKARVLDGAAEAFLIATVCSAPPDGHKRWSLVLLRDHLIASEYVDEVSHETVRQTLKKTNSSRG